MTELNEIELGIKECEELIATAEALEALRKNRHFKRVVEEGYLKQEAIRNTLNLDHAHLREASIRALAGVSSFNAYLQTIEQVAELAKQNMAELRQAHADVTVEE